LKVPEPKDDIDDNSNGVDSASEERKSQASASSVPRNSSTEGHSSVAPRRLREKSEDRSTRDSSPSSERSVRLRPVATELGMRERLVASCPSSRDRSPLPRDRDSRDTSKKRPYHERCEGGAMSSSASTCSEDSEMRVNDFLGKQLALFR
jgi:hypothetical protein